MNIGDYQCQKCGRSLQVGQCPGGCPNPHEGFPPPPQFETVIRPKSLADVQLAPADPLASLTAQDWRAIYERSGLDISPCGSCGAPVICIPDGFILCEPCALRESGAVDQLAGSGG